MDHIIKGNFSGDLCCNSYEALSHVVIKIYLPHAKSEVSSDIYRNPKSAPQLLDEQQIIEKKKHLIGTGKSDTSGNYEIKLSETYNGGPIVIDIVVPEISGQKSKGGRKVQFVVRKLQPVWRGIGKDLFYSWNYRFPYQFWGSIRALFDAWVICGNVKFEGISKAKTEGLQVTAYDTDWLKDDLLGTAKVNDKGYFRIDYTSSDFKKTFLSPVVNVETPLSAIPGPGVYFEISSPEGKIVYKEDRSYGRKEERSNIHQCFSVQLSISDNSAENFEH